MSVPSHILSVTLSASFALAGYASSHAASINAPTDTAAQTQTARGVLVAGEEADIAAAMSGRLISAPHKLGQYIKSGTQLARFDCKRAEAELAARQQMLTTLKLKFDNQSELLAMGAAGQLDVNIARSERDQVAAEITAQKISLRDCVIAAPFSGYITARHVNAFETPQLGQPIYSFIRAGSTELSVIAPSTWVRWLKAGQSFEFTVDETGERLTAKVVRLSAQVDPVSQTIEVTARPTGKMKAKPGMSGVARFSQSLAEK